MPGGAARLLAAGISAALLAGCADPPDPRLELGRRVFTELSSPRCATCHTLAEAGAAGNVGPNLDRLKPDEVRVAAAVTQGLGVMPAQRDNLTPEQIEAVAFYVASVTGGAPRPAASGGS